LSDKNHIFFLGPKPTSVNHKRLRDSLCLIC